MWFLSVGPEFCPSGTFHPSIRLPSDFTSRWTPLPSANASYYQAHSGLSPPSYRPCRAHKRFAKPILSVLRFQMNIHLNLLDIHCNGYSQIFFENLLPNRRFGVETASLSTISTNYNHYIYCLISAINWFDFLKRWKSFLYYVIMSKIALLGLTEAKNCRKGINYEYCSRAVGRTYLRH